MRSSTKFAAGAAGTGAATAGATGSFPLVTIGAAIVAAVSNPVLLGSFIGWLGIAGIGIVTGFAASLGAGVLGVAGLLGGAIIGGALGLVFKGGQGAAVGAAIGTATLGILGVIGGAIGGMIFGYKAIEPVIVDAVRDAAKPAAAASVAPQANFAANSQQITAPAAAKAVAPRTAPVAQLRFG